MGTYLSTPVTEKNEEAGESLDCPSTPVAWGVVDMQGWRKSMEDAHVAQTDIVVPSHHFNNNENENNNNNEMSRSDGPLPPRPNDGDNEDDPSSNSSSSNNNNNVDGKVFGVFDGHGGPEVARFCQLYLVAVLTQQATWMERQERNDDNEDPVEVVLPKETDIGQALVSAFHALDRMIDDPARRDELIQLRTIKPEPGERKDAKNIPPLLHMATSEQQQQQSPSATATTVNKAGSPPPCTEESSSPQPQPSSSPPPPPESSTTAVKDDEGDDAVQQQQEPSMNGSSSSVEEQKDNADWNEEKGGETDVIKKTNNNNNNNNNNNEPNVKSDKENEEECDDNDDDNDDDDDDDGKDDESNEVVGKEEAAEIDQDMMDDDDDEEEEEDNANASGEEEEEDPASTGTAGKAVTVMFQRLLNMSGGGGSASGQIVVQLPDDAEDESEGSNNNDNAAKTPQTGGSPSANPTSGPSAMEPTLVQNGRLICNLPDHPVHAGATAVVAVIVGRTVTVANAGDSRAVLCRCGTAYPLSFDHKPLQERELTRIRNAGGFVNHFGRVNGNLNLSRSIGDLKYKQVPNIPPAEQMITAEPDIVQTTLEPDDEFIILGCDGIWDCLSNEKAVEYVRHRIDSKTPTEIGVEMLGDIISEDPRATQGIGGDNMTVLIVDLQPHSRSYRKDLDANAI